ncbi:hypothetical protein F5B21DRAFT_205209 [Xylaria acuta]|nr:hypothetical protein F5B21DRAFT_205209 [Xylaria acuta]
MSTADRNCKGVSRDRCTGQSSVQTFDRGTSRYTGRGFARGLRLACSSTGTRTWLGRTMGRCCNSSRMRWQVACRSLVWACRVGGFASKPWIPSCAPEEADIGNRAPRNAQNYGYVSRRLLGGDLSRLCLIFRVLTCAPDLTTGLHRPNRRQGLLERACMTREGASETTIRNLRSWKKIKPAAPGDRNCLLVSINNLLQCSKKVWSKKR